MKNQLVVLALFFTSAPAAFGSKAVKESPLTFESAFAVKGEPVALNYQVRFKMHDGTHTMQVWRDSDKRLRRKTDGAIDTYVIRDAADPNEYQMIVVDYSKHVTTRIDRNALIRLGHFTDWFDLAHGLRHPTGEYRLTAASAPPSITAPISSCRWYEIKQDNGVSRICWSERDRLPLLIWSSVQGVVWEVTAVSDQTLASNVFDLHDAGFVRNNANADINDD